MNTDLRRRFVRDLVADITQVGGARFEDFATYVDGLISATPGLRRGTNLEGTPVSGAVDSVTPSGDRVVEASSDKDYFRPKYAKVWHDLRHAVAEHPGAAIALYSSRECGPEASTYLTRLVRRLKRKDLALEWYRQNVVSLLKSSSVLLVLDNLLVDLDMQRLADCCGERSKLPLPNEKLLLISRRIRCCKRSLKFLWRYRKRSMLFTMQFVIWRPCVTSILNALQQSFSCEFV
jgi:hypothetical protein